MERITIHSIIGIPELAACLSAYLTTSDIAHAMATCKAWSLQFQPFLWSNLRTGALLPKRHTLKQNLHHIRTIDLDQRVTSPFRPLGSNANALELLTALLHGLPTPLTLGSNMAEAGRDCEQTAETTVALCTNLRRIKAVLCSSPVAPEDASWIYLEPLLRNNNNLTHLHIEFSGFTPPPIEEAFSVLYRLHHLYIQAPMQEESWFLSLLRASLPLPRLSELYYYFAIASEHYTFKSNSEGGYKGMDDVAEPRGELKAILETAIAARTSRNGSRDFKIKTLRFPHPRNGDIISIALPILRSELVDVETLEVPQLYYYRGGKFYENVARKYCPRLRHLIIPTYYDEDHRHPAAMCSFIRGAVELKTVRGIHFHDTVDSGSSRVISTLITYHSKTLEELELLESSLIFSSDQQAILASCQNLKRFWITPDWGDNVEQAFLFADIVDQEWGCLGLRELCLTLNRSVDYRSARVAMQRELTASRGQELSQESMKEEELEDDLDQGFPERERQVKAWAAKRVFKQIGRLLVLETLSLGTDESVYGREEDSRVSEWDLTLSKGSLAELAGLKNLRRLHMRTDYWSKMGQAEVEFMDARWPWLDDIAFEVKKSDFHGLMKQPHWQWLQQKRPGLRLTFHEPLF